MKFYLHILFLLLTINVFGQRILEEKITYFNIIEPKEKLDASIKSYDVIVNIPYTMTVDDVKAQSLKDFEAEKAEYQNVLKQSKIDFQSKLDNHDAEVAQAKENYESEMKHFKSLSLLERLALTDQGKKPVLKTPAKPTYVEPRKPQYQEPRLADYLIFDKEALEDNIKLNGFDKGEGVTFTINMSKMEFQENAGQTFYKQPTTLSISTSNGIISEKVFGDESKFLTASSSNTINLNRYEKDNVNKTLAEIEKYINENYGYTPVQKSISIEFPKNKKREYDGLEKAKITAISALRKMTKNTSVDRRNAAIAEIEKAEALWQAELEKVDYSDKKATYNADIAKSIFFNLLTIQTQLGQKEKAEATLSALQDKRIDLDLSSSEETRLANLETQIYKL
ncbi:hypothetical protein ACFQ1Q_11795 [Winogradskyella litorisediminis]|uniref:Outer membrane protein TolC n=1 Tax=Winogradskyella litorisediminis TaxID=1156618 RepID=A0ABW3NC50_9FLAO